MSFILKVPTHLDGRNPLVGRYTARELVPIVASAFAVAGALGQPHLPAPVRIGEAVSLVVLGSVAGLVRPSGRSLVAWGRLLAAHLLSVRTSAWRPPMASPSTRQDVEALRPPHLAIATGAATPDPTPPASRHPTPDVHAARRPATHSHPFVPVEIDDDILIFADGHRCAVLECSGTNVEGMDVEEQRALHAAYHAFLLGLAFPVQVLVCADPVDLSSYAARRRAQLGGLPLAVRRLGSADAAYMRRTLAREGALEHRVYVVIPATPSLTADTPDGARFLALLHRRHPLSAGRLEDDAERQLAERCDTIREGLAHAGVHTWRLNTSALRVLYYRRLCPRTACLQPFDGGPTAQVAARVVFSQGIDNAIMGSTDDEEDHDDDESA